MPLLGFQKQFAPLVESGEKRQTIRAYRKYGRDPKVGDRLYLYTGLRTKQCRKLGEAVCVETTNVFLYANGNGACRLAINCIALPVDDISEFAKTDGFETPKSMIEWFKKTHGIPSEGLLIRWGDIEFPTSSDGSVETNNERNGNGTE